MTTRRTFLAAGSAAVCGLLSPLTGFAQRQRSSPLKIGLLEPGPLSSYANWRKALVTGLGELGYVQGRDVLIEDRAAEGDYDRLPGLAAELVRIKVDVIVASTTTAIRAAKQATTAVPIVMVRPADPVGSGFVASLRHPGGNITGLSNVAVDLSSKYLELLRVALPRLSRVAVLVNTSNPVHGDFLKGIRATENANGMKVLPALVTGEGQIESTFASMKRDHPGALIVLPDSLFFSQANRIAALAIRQNLPTMFGTREPVESGGLMSYGQDFAEHYYRAARYIDKIVKGAKPGDLPVEQPTKIELVVNLKTAKALGLEIPQSLLMRADRVIE